MLKKYNLLVLLGFGIISILHSSFAVINEPPLDAVPPLDVPFQPSSVWLPAMLPRLDQILGTEMKEDFDFCNAHGIGLGYVRFTRNSISYRAINKWNSWNKYYITDCDRITGIISEYIDYYRPHVDELADIPGHESFTALRNAVLQIRRRLVREIRVAHTRTTPPAGRGGGSTSVALTGRGGSTSFNVASSSGTGPIRTNSQSRNQQGSRSGPYNRPPQGRVR